MRVKLVFAVFAFAIMALAAGQAMAATNNFSGGTTNYNTPGNWSLGRVPIAGDQANIGSGLSAALNSSVTGQPDSLWIGSDGYAGFLDIKSGGNLTVNGGVVVGYAGSSSAPLSTLTLSGGTLNINGAGQSMIGGDGAAPGKLVVSSGTLNINTTATSGPVLGVGGITAAGTGSVEQSGGTISIVDNSTASSMDGLNLGNTLGSTGSYVMSGGTLNVGSSTSDTPMNMFVGYKGQGTFTQTGGTVNVSRKLSIGSSTNAEIGSLYDMSTGNGVLNTGDIHCGDGGKGTLLIGDNSQVTAVVLRLARGNVASTSSTVTMTGGELNVYRVEVYATPSSKEAILNVQGGQMNITSGGGIFGRDAAIPKGVVNLSGGVIDMGGTNLTALQAFNFTGGELRNGNVDFSLVQDGGIYDVGYSITWTTEGDNKYTPLTTFSGNKVTGDYTQNAGSVLFEVGGSELNDLTVTGAVALNGTVEVSLLSGYTPTLGASFDLLDFASFSGTPTWDLPSLGSSLTWNIDNFAATGAISIMQAPKPGDANNDGSVNATDASIVAENWLSSAQSGIGWRQGDFSGDGRVDDTDAVIMAANWTGTSPGASVPEPATLLSLAALLLGFAAYCRTRSK